MNWLENIMPPPIVQPWGVARPDDLIGAIKDVTGSDDPIMPSDPEQRDRVIDRLEPEEPDRETPLRPTGDDEDVKTPLPRPEAGEDKPVSRPPHGSVKIPPLPDKDEIEPPLGPGGKRPSHPEAPPIIPPKPPAVRKPETKPSYPPPSYQPPRYEPPRYTPQPERKPRYPQQDRYPKPTHPRYPQGETYPTPRSPWDSWTQPGRKPKPQGDREAYPRGKYPGETSPPRGQGYPEVDMNRGTDRGSSSQGQSPWRPPMREAPSPTIRKPLYRLRQDVREWFREKPSQQPSEITPRSQRGGQQEKYPDNTYP